MRDEPKLTCKRSVADAGGYHFYPCGKPAKWLVNGRPRCGIHAKGHEMVRKPIYERTK